MHMFDPAHPGEIIRDEYLTPYGLTVTKSAELLGVTRQTLNNLVNRKSGISAEMAMRLEKAFGAEADFWMRMQINYDLAQVRKRADEIKVKRYVAA